MNREIDLVGALYYAVLILVEIIKDKVKKYKNIKIKKVQVAGGGN